MTEPSLPCIYCLKPNRAPGNEHVLLQAFETSWTLDTEVCHACNTQTLSPLDTRLVQHVRMFAYADHPDVPRNRTWIQDGFSFILDEANGVWVTTRPGKLPTDEVQIPPQFIRLDESRVVFWMGTCQREEGLRQAHLIRDEVTNQSLSDDSFSYEIVEWTRGTDPTPRPTLIRARRGRYALRATSRNECDELKEFARSGRMFRRLDEGEPLESKTGYKNGRHIMEFPIGKAWRALAKVAMNYACARLGQERVLLGDFEPLQRLVTLGDFDRFPEPFVPRPLQGADAQDAEHLAHMAMTRRAGHHAVLLADYNGAPHFVISLYGRPYGTIRLMGTGQLLQSGQVLRTWFPYSGLGGSRCPHIHEDVASGLILPRSAG